LSDELCTCKKIRSYILIPYINLKSVSIYYWLKTIKKALLTKIQGGPKKVHGNFDWPPYYSNFCLGGPSGFFLPRVPFILVHPVSNNSITPFLIICTTSKNTFQNNHHFCKQNIYPKLHNLLMEFSWSKHTKSTRTDNTTPTLKG
jgi:hypothetical protein